MKNLLASGTAGRPRLPRNRPLALLAIVVASLLFAFLVLAGCGGGNSSVSLGDLPEMTAETVGDLLVGPPPDPTADSPPDPPLLKKGAKEHVVLAADTAGFAAISRGNIPESALKDAFHQTVKLLDKRLHRRGFTVEESPVFPPAAPADPEKTLVATITPATEEAGSPQDKAQGRQRTMVLVRLTVTDPATGSVLRQRDFYSGKDAKGAQASDR